jgi:ABC transporter substrate binding protein
MIERREFIVGLGAAAWPVAALGQQAAIPVIGFLHSGSPEGSASAVGAFHKGLSEVGYVEGRNVAIEYHWANGDNARLPDLAADLVRRKVAVIVTRGLQPTRAAKAATDSISIVFGFGGDPVALGLVASLARPGGNVTGVTQLDDEVAQKRLEAMHALLPTATDFALLVDPSDPNNELQSNDMRAAARVLGLNLHILPASTTLLPYSRVPSGSGGRAHHQPKLYYSQPRCLREPAACTAGRAPRNADDLFLAGICSGRRPHELRGRGPRRVGSRCGRLYRAHFEGREACRSTGAAGDQDRACPQPEDRQAARRYVSAHPTRPRRQSDRIVVARTGGDRSVQPSRRQQTRQGRPQTPDPTGG